jgi:acetyl-CoA acetyltransferase
MAWRRAAISGVGASRQGTLPDETRTTLAVEALRSALDDAGLEKDELDGLLTMPGTSSPEGARHYLSLGEQLGINPQITGSLSMGGATGGSLVQYAALAIDAGLADCVACIFSDTARSSGSRFNASAGLGDPWGIWGMLGAAANSAMGARRHMELYGTTSEHLAAVAVTCRHHASLNPDAVKRNPITVEDHHASRMIVDPLRRDDCCLITDGAVCVIVTSTERAKRLRKPPVSIWGMGQAHTLETIANRDWWYLPHQQRAVAAAYAMAGVGPQDIDVAEFYDNFTVAVLFWLEHAGFCGPGEAGPWIEGGEKIRIGGDLPVNTAGGNLSESYMQGWLHIVEGVRQIRGECGERQVESAKVALVTGRGMTLQTSHAMVLGAEA